MNSQISLNDISPARITVAGLAAAAVWLLAPELAQAAITVGGFAAGSGMGVWGCIDMYKASKSQTGQSGNYAPGIAKVVIGALALGIGEFLGSGSATLFGSDQTTGLDELGLR